MAGAAGDYRVAVLLPCRNEEAAIGGVVRAFREALPRARVYVYDNASTDGAAAAAAPALVERLVSGNLDMVVGVLAGVILDSVNRGRREAKRLAYLRYPSVLESARRAED